MPAGVGIPRALLYYYYYPLWKEFFKTLGCEVIISDKTNKAILNDGLSHCVDEACLPVKLAFGHVLNLAAKKVDYIFIPRLVSVAKGEYICPKFLGFPDMVKHSLTGLPEIIDVTINMRLKHRELSKAYTQVGKLFTGNRVKIWQAYRRGEKALKRYNQLLLEGCLPEEAFAVMEGKQKQSKLNSHDLKIAVIGHPYNIYDPYISMNIIKRLNSMGARVVTADQLPEEVVRREAANLPKKLFWTLGQRMVGAGYSFVKDNNIDGIINIVAFACGPDSMTGELIARSSRKAGQTPFLNLTLDEHTGEAGVVTRIEAFLDMVRWKKSQQAAGLGSA
ncbi:putative nucleotide-binding protein (sugar kinase/HSP70/actin superfamily) [Desulfohalotomaculum tongense]|uniref:acyl-CoA dehydratase activase-related protein n=1 Tax=Desulforadius tongensis TaxID=1216062 RepID=UPI00195795A5|nr:acyl-CoA dehydratase activase-related protein [Desulforadius tongensis]MBM7854689.1 putative nucleotide-binding protein (sugar kinase/HSP70/actin superfamily) [Desulforadius tongensis]